MSNKPDYSKSFLLGGMYVTPAIKRADIMNFIGKLHDIQNDYIEEALEKSDMKEAKEVINRIKELK